MKVAGDSTNRILLVSVGVTLSCLLFATGNKAAELDSAITATYDTDFSKIAKMWDTPSNTFELDQKQKYGSNQKPQEETLVPSSQEPVGCDAASGYLDHAVIDTLKLEGASLIIIARLGTGEKSSRLNQQRLSVEEEYIKRRGSNLKYILAQGDRVVGLGRVELYVGGRLLHILPFKKNAKSHCLPNREGY